MNKSELIESLATKKSLPFKKAEDVVNTIFASMTDALLSGWRVNGRHYQRTCEDWLKLQDARREQIMPILRESYGDGAELWFQRWRVFFMACAELFGYNDGNEWFVGHYLLKRADLYL